MINPSTKNHIKYYQGNAPIILSAPHGGDEKPTNINTRLSGVFDKDDYTYELTELIIQEFDRQTSLTPYAIIADISREKVDLNRIKTEAYEDDKAAIVYNQFHDLIKSSEIEVSNQFSKGLYIDIHGQSHPKGYLEFGYLLDNNILKQSDDLLKQHKQNSSISVLSKFSTECFTDQIKGPFSMGTLMCNQGYDSVPSQKIPYATDDNYFEGAYDTISYGSKEGGNICGIQIEFPYQEVRDTQENREKCARAFVHAILIFVKKHFDLDLKK